MIPYNTIAFVHLADILAHFLITKLLLKHIEKRNSLIVCGFKINK